jgi:molecular chaperone HscB
LFGRAFLSVQDSMSELKTMPVRCSTCEVLTQAPLACTDCHSLLAHVEGANYFELFGLPRSYALDLGELSRKYLAISRNIHPDKFATQDDQMQSFALRMSAAVNKGYEVLGDPFQRAEYLLELSGGKSAAHDKRVPPELLNRVMILREEIEEAKEAEDAGTLAALKANVTRQRDAVQERIEELCAGLGESGQDVRDDLRLNLNSMKYLENLVTQLC